MPPWRLDPPVYSIVPTTIPLLATDHAATYSVSMLLPVYLAVVL